MLPWLVSEAYELDLELQGMRQENPKRTPLPVCKKIFFFQAQGFKLLRQFSFLTLSFWAFIHPAFKEEAVDGLNSSKEG